MRRLALAVAAFLAAGVAAPPARAEQGPALQRFADGIASTDGARFVHISVINPDRSTFGPESIYDDATGRTTPVASDCRADFAFGGIAAFTWLLCAGQPARIWDLALNTTQIAAPLPNGDGTPYSYTLVLGAGARWLRLAIQGGRSGSIVYEDWRTGRIRREPGPGAYADLDAPGLARPLCRPLRRVPDPDEPATFEPLAYDPPYAVRTSRRGLFLERCGRRRSTVLERGPVAGFQLGAGIVTWSTVVGHAGTAYHPGPPYRWTLHALLLASGRRLTWRFVFPPELNRSSVSIEHTARAVYVTKYDPRASTDTVLRARLPRARSTPTR